jgi:glyoxylase-like metal-dependent hydrolase (beta-lactamase superfamily II)
MDTYSKGLRDVGGSCYAWLQPDGGWGWSNSGVITGSGASLLVDTLFDLATTADMLDGIADVTDRSPLRTLVNTHSDGDHYFGNQLVAERDVEIVASEAAAALMTQESVDELAALKRADGKLGDFARTVFGPFTFDGITSTGPTRTFSGELSIDVGGREVQLIQVGPAHTPGDVLVHVPDAKLMFAGDILFIGGTPIVWAGPTERWIAACDLLLDLDLDVIVPGHGPVTDKSGVHQVRDYLQFVLTEATKRFEEGLDIAAAIASIDLGKYASLPQFGRLAQNVANVYRSLDPDAPQPSTAELLEQMARLEGI